MASNLSTRAARTACTSSRSAARSFTAVIPRRTYASSSNTPTAESDQPRWSFTPPRAKAPFSLHTNSTRAPFYVNSDPAVLDQFYVRMLGNGGDKFLSDEVKWLAITHKSFDQGRRGFNDRLTFLGKRIVQLQASLALVQNPGTATVRVQADEHGRKPFAHPALDGLKNLSSEKKSFLTDRRKLAELARKYDMDKVIRWLPRDPENLSGSGIDLVLAHTMYAIIGAVSLEKGGHIANKVAQERILEPLGLKKVS